MLKVGDPIPSAVLYETYPDNEVNTTELCKDKKVVMFGVTGAFTPSCSTTHLPGFVERYPYLIKKGVHEVACVSVNDVFIMTVWGKVNYAYGKIRMLADPDAVFTKLAGLELKHFPELGSPRCKRFSMIVENGIIKFFNLEPDGVGLSCSLAQNLSI